MKFIKKYNTYSPAWAAFMLLGFLAFPSLLHAQLEHTYLMENGKNITINGCEYPSGIIYDDGGSVDNYSNNFDGTVTLQCTPGFTLHLWGEYDVETNYDFLIVSDADSVLVNNISGNDTLDVKTTTGLLTLHFKSDYTSTRSGFALQWEVTGQEANCSNIVSNLQVTDSSTTTLSLSWQATQPAGPFTVIAGGKEYSGITTTSYVLSGLNPSSYYSIEVIATSAIGSQCCADRAEARTLCDDVEITYSEGFEGIPEAAFPSCWIEAVNFDDEDFLPQVVTPQHYSGTRSLMSSCGNTETSGHFGLVATPPINATGSLTIRLWMCASHDNLVVNIGTCNATGNEYDQYGFVSEETLTIDRQWREYTFTWTASTAGKRVGFYMLQSEQAGTGRRLYIDEASVEYCGIYNVEAQHIEHNKVQLTWSGYGNPTYTVGVRRVGQLTDTLTFPSATSPLDINGLQPETRYVFSVYPSCTLQDGLARSCTARTAAAPLAADGYCSNFSESTLATTDWTFFGYYSNHFSFYNRVLYFSGYPYAGSEGAFAVSEQLQGLAGQDVAITYSGPDYGSYIVVGTLQVVDDISTFEAIDTLRSNGYRNTAICHVPTTSTGRYVALRYFTNWATNISLHCVRIGSCIVDGDRVLHRRGSKVTLSWAAPYDTVLVQYGPHGFELGTGQIDTFYNVKQGVIEGLSAWTTYDLFVYRPCRMPCEDMRQTIRTGRYDYPLPYCESFESIDNNDWWNGDWEQVNQLNNAPEFVSSIDYMNGKSLRLSSMGFDWDYYCTALLPDVEIDSNTILSFYAYNLAPKGYLVLGTLGDGFNRDGYSDFRSFDTVFIDSTAYHHRQHYNIPLPSTDSIFNRRLAVRYYHPFEYSNYSIYIDELQFAHQSYGQMAVLYTGADTAVISLDTVIMADSVEVTLVGDHTFSRRVAADQIDAIEWGGLDSSGFYRVYVQTLDEGCLSYAGWFVLVGGDGYAYCYPFDELLSYEFYRQWATSGSYALTDEGHLLMHQHSAVATHLMNNPAGLTYTLTARGHSNADTLVLGALGSAACHKDSVHFAFDESTFIVLDTFVLDTSWHTFAISLGNAEQDSMRLCLYALQDSILIDDIGWTGCPIVNFRIEGNTIVCEAERNATYYLYVDDLDGEEKRVLIVDRTPYTIEGLQLGHDYRVSWQCMYSDAFCADMSVVLHSGSTIPLPYCVDFDNGSGAGGTLPPTWEFVMSDPSSLPSLSTWGPSLQMPPAVSGKWNYAILPEFEMDSVLSVIGYLYDYGHNNYGRDAQIGVLLSDTDTSTFIDLSPNHDYWWAPKFDLSQYAGKRVAIRNKSQLNIFSLHFYNIPFVHVRQIKYDSILLQADKTAPYWIHYSAYNSTFTTRIDTTLLITDSLYTICARSDISYLIGCDSMLTSCENTTNKILNDRLELPHCYNDMSHTRWPWDTHTYGWLEWSNYNSTNQYMRFYTTSSSWAIGPDFYQADSTQHLGMLIDYIPRSAMDTLVVGVMTDALDTLTFTPVDTLTLVNDFDSVQSAYVDFSRYEGTGRWVAFHALPHSDAKWIDIKHFYIDDCQAALSATARLSRWNRVAIQGTTTPFYAEYYPTGTSYPGAPENTVVRIDSVPTTLTLAPATYYDFLFHCDSLETLCMPAQQVLTLEAPLDVPSCIDFDTVASASIPRGWRRFNSAIGSSNLISHSDTNSLAMPINSSSYIVSPDVDVDSMSHITMSIWFKVDDLSDRLVVGVMSDQADLGTFVPIRTLTPFEVGVWQHGQVEFHNAPSDSYFIALRARSNHQGGGRSIYVDDIYISDCAAFDFNVQRLASEDIDLSWQQIGTPDITVQMFDDGVLSQTFTNPTSPLHIEPLNSLHYYTFTFNSTCGSSNDYCNTDYTDTISVVTPAPGIGCVNPTDLASPQAVFYSGTYKNPYSRAGAVNYGPLHPDSRHTVCYDTAQRDPRTAGLLRTIPEGYTNSVRLGNWNSNIYAPEAEGVIYSLYVDTSSFELLLMRYAAVLQDPLHAVEDQPRFRMELLDTNFNLIDSACTSADFIADQSLGWNTAENGVLWKDWTSVGVDLSAYAGQQVYFRLTTYDCNEGSHYGYAYFTLECQKKNNNELHCGAADSLTFTAPEGFHYQWTIIPSTTVISTEQSITRAPSDVTYQCKISKLDNPNCYFTINSYGGTRFPMAAIAHSITIDSCRFHVDFTNLGGVSKTPGGELIPGIACSSSYWDFGNGKTDTTWNASTTYYPHGTYTVTLINTYLNCADTTTLVLNLRLPDDDLLTDTTRASICDNEVYHFRGADYHLADTIRDYAPTSELCDSLYMLILDVRPTTASNTYAVVCDSMHWNGILCDTTGLYTSSLPSANSVGCDSLRILHLTVHPSYDTVDTIRFCPYDPIIYHGISYPGPAVFDTVMLTQHGCDSTVHVSLAARDPRYAIRIFYSLDSNHFTEADSLIVGCSPTLLTMRDSSTASVAWQWTVISADTLTTSDSSELRHRWTNWADTMTSYIHLVTTDTMGCLDTLTWPVIKLRKPQPDFRWEPDFPSMSQPEAQMVNLSWPDTCRFAWSFQRANGYGTDASHLSAPYHVWGQPEDQITGDFSVVLTEYWIHHIAAFNPADFAWIDSLYLLPHNYEAFDYECIDSIEHFITITNDYLQFPNLVSPNGDGINDTWEVVNLVEFGNYSMNELWIYDRTGALVFHAKNIYRHDQFWDPNATRSPDGTYYFRFLGEGQYGVVKRNGVIEVVRDVDDD